MEPKRTLAELTAGQSARVQSLRLTGNFRNRLLDIGLIPGTFVTCVHCGSGIAAYCIRGAVIALRRCDAAGVVLSLSTT